ncbi:hypothetical protein AGABI1DRAFT_114695 [Agaricus bisporus var. burnettii JB137-S8]|uniref:Uncharacterized protein n=1 Tax=Agaricus bisporus var. burnettii (strain JB137-S8 / ATCC MYA-4627 / FGSC 10392) TaxID=597362 RepID=K5VVA5_AGABU|nr:uncharacterized protein AGABI1DRAFT_114695 [Agaricus bisporus var. burnettii JB137-S8]EKM78409.1 hypothetical protein AGABI1DRAFT_114695 [Agaricus bisporus var. burnettii JB137-S8]
MEIRAPRWWNLSRVGDERYTRKTRKKGLRGSPAMRSHLNRFHSHHHPMRRLIDSMRPRAMISSTESPYRPNYVVLTEARPTWCLVG